MVSDPSQSNRSEAAAADRGANDGAPQATQGQKIGLMIYLGVLSFVFLGFGAWAIDSVDRTAHAVVSVAWEKPPEVSLAPGPPSFRYDASTQQLIHKGEIDADRKKELRRVFEFSQLPPETGTDNDSQSNGGPGGADGDSKPPEGNGGPSGPDGDSKPPGGRTNEPVDPDSQGGTMAGERASREAYYAAVDQLAFLANEDAVPSSLTLLWLGSIAAILGALLRSFVDFVGTASYKNNFNVLRWWPLHVTRPFVAAILGPFVIVLFRAGLMTSTSAPSISSLWSSLGVAFLAGFSTVDVTLRLKITAKALFGIEPDSGGRQQNAPAH